MIIVVNKSPHKERKQEQSPVMVFSRNLFPRGHIIDSSDPPLFIESSTAISMIPPKHHKHLLVLATIDFRNSTAYIRRVLSLTELNVSEVSVEFESLISDVKYINKPGL